MSALRALVVRWSARDRLATLGIALTVALLVGATTTLAAAGAEVTAVAGGVEGDAAAEWYDSPAAARERAGPGDAVYPVAVLAGAGGSNGSNGSVTVVGVPPDAPTGTVAGDGPGPNRSFVLPAPPDPGNATGPVEAPARVVLRGDGARVELLVAPRGDDSPFPPSWYLARADATRRLGVDGALLVRPDAAASGGVGPGGVPARGVPLVSALPFFAAGTAQLLATLWPLAGGAAVLAGVVAFSVTRMAVRDRTATVGVLRATGAPPRRVLGAFALRGALLAGVGCALGYALGLVAARVAVAAATVVGLPTTLDPRVTPAVAGVLVPALAALVAVGAVSGGAAALPAVRRPPGALLSGPDRGRAPGPPGPDGDPDWRDRLPGIPSVLRPRLLDRRALVPTAATLSVFAAAVLLVAALGATLAPLAAADSGTITQEGAAHPVNSRVDAGYATALRARGVPASPEVVLFSVVDGEPFLARGANFSAFAEVADARVVRGRAPAGPDEAVVGADLAGAAGVDVGDRVLLGGSVAPAVARVRVVGVYRAPGLRDDQLVVGLPVARHLSNAGPGRVNLVRVGDVDRLGPPGGGPDGGDPDGTAGSAVVVTDVSTPERVRAGDRFRVTVAVRNLGERSERARIRVSVGNRSRVLEPELPGGTARRLRPAFRLSTPGEYAATAGGVSSPVRVEAADALRVGRLPERVAPNATLLVPVTDARGRPVPNATVSAGPASARTDDEGLARLPVPAPGEYALRASAAGRSPAERSLRVAAGAPRLPLATVTVSPRRPTVFSRPTAAVVLTNPYADPLAATVRVEGPAGPTERRVSLAPGASAERTVRLGRTDPGRYDVVVRAGGTDLARTTYEVTGDERVVSALSGAGRVRRGSGLGQGIAGALGNLRVVLATLLALSALATVGTVAAAFAAAVHARRETLGIRRATGATPRRVLAAVVADAARIAVLAVGPALLVAVGAVLALRAAGLLTVFGVTVAPRDPALALAGAGAGGILVACCGAAMAALPAVRRPPAALLEGSGARPPADPSSGGPPDGTAAAGPDTAGGRGGSAAGDPGRRPDDGDPGARRADGGAGGDRGVEGNTGGDDGDPQSGDPGSGDRRG